MNRPAWTCGGCGIAYPWWIRYVHTCPYRKHRFRCDVMGWHKPRPWQPEDGEYGTCRWCGITGLMQDSQGNWF